MRALELYRNSWGENEDGDKTDEGKEIFTEIDFEMKVKMDVGSLLKRVEGVSNTKRLFNKWTQKCVKTRE
jgi:hypothetical protein